MKPCGTLPTQVAAYQQLLLSRADTCDAIGCATEEVLDQRDAVRLQPLAGVDEDFNGRFRTEQVRVDVIDVLGCVARASGFERSDHKHGRSRPRVRLCSHEDRDRESSGRRPARASARLLPSPQSPSRRPPAGVLDNVFNTHGQSAQRLELTRPRKDQKGKRRPSVAVVAVVAPIRGILRWRGSGRLLCIQNRALWIPAWHRRHTNVACMRNRERTSVLMW